MSNFRRTYERWRKKIREKGNERISFLIIPHNEKTILNLQLSKFTMAFGAFIFLLVIITSIFATNRQSVIKVEADHLADKDRAVYNERELYRRKYKEMAVQQEQLKKKIRNVLIKAYLETENAEIFKENSFIEDRAQEQVDEEAKLYLKQVKEKHAKAVKPGIAAVLTNKTEQVIKNDFYYHPEVVDYRRLNLDIKQTLSALNSIKRFVKERENVQNALPYYWPIAGGHFTSFYGPRISPFGYSRDFHTGIDLADSIGTPIYAAGDGNIMTTGMTGGYGLMVKVRHPYGFITLYGHMSTIYVRTGQFVKKGQIIGRVGNTGRVTGPHLHYEVRIQDRAIDPLPYLTSG